MHPSSQTALWLASQSTIWKMVRHLGGFAFIPIGLLDQSVIPLPGSLDATLLVLAGANHELWWYYAIMATVGSLAGCYLSYRIGREGGKEALEKKLPKKRVEKVYHIFEKYGFWSLAVPAVLPPPVPIVPFVIAAGAMNYPLHKFFLSLGLGRAIRFAVVGYLASIYGHQIFGFFRHYYKPVLIGLCSLAAAGVIGFFIFRHWYKEHHHGKDPITGKAGEPKAQRDSAA